MAPIKKRSPAKSGKTKKQTTRKNQVGRRNPPKKGIPFLAIFVALLLMGFLGYFIFSAAPPKAAIANNKPTLNNEEQLPEKPQPQWEYENTLKIKEVEVDIPAEKKNKRDYQMQCASFRKKGDAESLKANIAFQGLNSQIRKTGDWYRVILGPYERKRLAEKDRHKLQRAKINGCQIWYWR